MKTKIILGFLCFIIPMCSLGCAALSYQLTPAELDPNALKYAVKAGTADPNDFGWYENLDKAIKLEKAVDEAHTIIQFGLQQEVEKDNLEYSLYKGSTSAKVAAGMQREELLFGPKGLLSLGLSLAGFGSVTGFIGLMRKRPGDVTKVEMEDAMKKVTGELTNKDKQFIQLVKGIQEFVNTYEDKEIVKSLKKTLESNQDSDTIKAVAVAKKT